MILSPKLIFAPAPACAAPMMPSPAPVMVMKFASVTRRANSVAQAKAGAVGRVRAEPKMQIFLTWR